MRFHCQSLQMLATVAGLAILLSGCQTAPRPAEMPAMPLSAMLPTALDGVEVLALDDPGVVNLTSTLHLSSNPGFARPLATPTGEDGKIWAGVYRTNGTVLLGMALRTAGSPTASAFASAAQCSAGTRVVVADGVVVTLAAQGHPGQAAAASLDMLETWVLSHVERARTGCA